MESEKMSAEQQLKLLRSSQTSALLAAEVPPSPWWYSAALATVIGALSLFDGGGGSIGWLVLGLATTALLAVHYFPTITVVPRRSRRTVVGNLAILAVCWALVTTWGVLLSTDRLDGTGPGRWVTIAALWVGTGAVLAVAILVQDRWRRRAVLSVEPPAPTSR